MTARLPGLILAVLLALGAPQASAQKGVPPTSVTVGGKQLVSDRTILENLSQSGDHTVFTGLLRLSGLADGLQGHGPFTVFAPTDAAFAALPPGLLDSLRKPDSKPALAALLSTQVVEGNYSLARFHYLLRAGKGQVELDTVNDGKITVGTNGPANLVVRDPKGDTAAVTLYDVKSANGVIFVTDRVLRPN